MNSFLLAEAGRYACDFLLLITSGSGVSHIAEHDALDMAGKARTSD